MGKTRDLFKKIRNTKGTYHAKMDTIEDRNGLDLTEAEGGKNTQKYYTKKIFMTHRYDDGVITHLESDILECEIKWALGSITINKLVQVMEFQLTYFKT